jgi:hypothetical protein
MGVNLGEPDNVIGPSPGPSPREEGMKPDGIPAKFSYIARQRNRVASEAI